MENPALSSLAGCLLRLVELFPGRVNGDSHMFLICDGLVTFAGYHVKRGGGWLFAFYSVTFLPSFLMLIILVDSHIGRTHELEVPSSLENGMNWTSAS